MMKNYVILFFLCLLQAQGHINNETGWEFYSSPEQSFYIFDDIQIDGQIALGDGWYPSNSSPSSCLENSYSCDVLGAFLDDVCVGWVYADSEGYTTLPIMGIQSGDLTTSEYCSSGDIPQIKIYDSSVGSTLEVLTSDEIPGWESNGVSNIQNISFANNGIYNQSTGWNYYQSSNQSFYLFEDIILYDSINVESEDIIGAFKDNVCVGWININPEGYTSVPVMGVEGDLYPNYMEEGDIPEFKIYDYSNDDFFNLVSL